MSILKTRVFQQPYEDLLERQVEIRDDEARLIDQSKDFNCELEQLFEADQRAED